MADATLDAPAASAAEEGTVPVLGSSTPAIQGLPGLTGLTMLGSDDVGVCVDGVCQVPGA